MMRSVVANQPGLHLTIPRTTLRTDRLARPLAFATMLLVSPLFVIIAGLIVISSRGPVLVKRPISLCNGHFAYATEFRTRPLFDPAKVDRAGCPAKSRTAIGRVLHITSLSRLPRLLDVSTGFAALG